MQQHVLGPRLVRADWSIRVGISARVREAEGFLTRLRRDVAGNVAAITAASLVPLIALVGGGIDLSRLYLTKVRLQHACDAGALAGRKAMGAGTWSQSDPSPNGSATQFFVGNFKDGSYGTTDRTSAFSEKDGKVSGVASASVPMTLMGFFGVKPQPISVTCTAQMQIPNTDVMFVLDNTGSMNDKANAGDPDSKIDTLKYSVKCFYEAVTQLTTDAGCPAGTSTGKGINSSAQVRFGFVPYSQNVNVGRLLPSTWFASTWPYQSRIGQFWVVESGPTSNSVQKSYPVVKESDCSEQKAKDAGFEKPDDPKSYNSNVVTKDDDGDIIKDANGFNYWKHVDNDVSNVSYNKGQCSGTITSTTTTYILRETTSPATGSVFERWHYSKITQNISGLKNGSGWNSGLTLAIGTGGAAKSMPWDGCIEERATVRATDYDPIPSGAQDLDIDSKPSGTGSFWGPAIPTMLYPRKPSAYAPDEVYTTDEYPSSGYGYACPAAAKKLQVWSDPSLFDTYVDSLTPTGNTYHDIGMLWGGRLMSPTGIFGNENAATPAGGIIQRHMIFMTDGDAQSTPCNYSAYGMMFFDQRTTTDVGAYSSSTCNKGRTSLISQVNLRLETLCSAVKKKGINLYVISFGGGDIAASTKTRLQNCATDSNHYYDAGNADQLKAAFASIAAQITQLRLIQ